jgi:hypothetical protein
MNAMNNAMNNAMDTFKDNLSLNLFGRERTLALALESYVRFNRALESCVSCGKVADRFTDKLSRQEFGISGKCQDCQNRFFCEDMSDEG